MRGSVITEKVGLFREATVRLSNINAEVDVFASDLFYDLPQPVNGGHRVAESHNDGSVHPMCELEHQRILELLNEVLLLDIAKPLQSPMSLARQANNPVDLKLLADRLRNGYYRTKEAIRFDARAFLNTVM